MGRSGLVCCEKGISFFVIYPILNHLGCSRQDVEHPQLRYYKHQESLKKDGDAVVHMRYNEDFFEFVPWSSLLNLLWSKIWIAIIEESRTVLYCV
jgi:hypothetical protein